MIQTTVDSLCRKKHSYNSLLHVVTCSPSVLLLCIRGKAVYSVALVTGAVPVKPGSPLLAIPANNFLISAIARPGLRPLGQVLVQFMMVWHLYTLKGSLSLSSLSAWCPSLLSMIHL